MQPAKTASGCFKYRRKVGPEIAIEALRDYRRQCKATMDSIQYHAKIDRVANIGRPYAESLV